MCSSWSARICFVSKSSRPIRVDLPSSTEPAVTRRTSSVCMSASEVANALPVFHCGLAGTVVRPRLAALGDPGRCDLGDDVLERTRLRRDCAGAAHVADGAEADRKAERLLALHSLDEVADGVQHPVAAEDLALVGE